MNKSAISVVVVDKDAMIICIKRSNVGVDMFPLFTISHNSLTTLRRSVSAVTRIICIMRLFLVII